MNIMHTIRTLAVCIAISGFASASMACDFYYPANGQISYIYGEINPFGIWHSGIDIANDSAYWSYVPICAARLGYVTYGWSNEGYGNLAVVSHAGSYQTYYAHNGWYVGGGPRWVSRGEAIAAMGSTGNSTGPHVHFEVRRWGYFQYVPATKYAFVNVGQGINYDYPGIDP